MLTRAEAIDARDRIDQRRHRKRPKSGLYRCAQCGTWHLTSASVDRTPALRAYRRPSPELMDLDELPLRVPQRVLRRG